MRFTIKLKLALAFSLINLLLIGATRYGVASLAGMNDTMTGLIAGRRLAIRDLLFPHRGSRPCEDRRGEAESRAGARCGNEPSRSAPVPKGKFIPARKPASSGFALDLAKGGPDAADAKFKSFS